MEDWKKKLGVTVYSTNPDYKYDEGKEEADTIANEKQQLITFPHSTNIKESL